MIIGPQKNKPRRTGASAPFPELTRKVGALIDTTCFAVEGSACGLSLLAVAGTF